MRVVKHWNRLPRKLIDASSLETFKVRLDRTSLVEDVPGHWKGQSDYMTFKYTFQPKPFYDSVTKFSRFPLKPPTIL